MIRLFLTRTEASFFSFDQLSEVELCEEIVERVGEKYPGIPDYKKKYLDTASGLQIIFRNRQYSKSYVPSTILKIIEDGRKKNSQTDIIITATDAELFGLRHNDQTGKLERLLNYQ